MVYLIMELYLTSVAGNCINEINFKGKKKVAFISTASELDSDIWYVQKDKEALISKGLEVIDYDIKNKSFIEMESDFNNFEIIFVAGGNSFYLLKHMKESGFDKVLENLKSSDKIYIGSSAGSVIMCPDISFLKLIDEPEKVFNFKDYSGLNFVDFYFLPHCDNESFKEGIQEILKQYSNLNIHKVNDDELVFVEIK